MISRSQVGGDEESRKLDGELFPIWAGLNRTLRLLISFPLAVVSAGPQTRFSSRRKRDLWSYFQNYSRMEEWVVAYTLWLLVAAQNINTVRYLDSDTFSIILALHSNTWSLNLNNG